MHEDVQSVCRSGRLTLDRVGRESRWRSSGSVPIVAVPSRQMTVSDPKDVRGAPVPTALRTMETLEFVAETAEGLTVLQLAAALGAEKERRVAEAV